MAIVVWCVEPICSCILALVLDSGQAGWLSSFYIPDAPDRHHEAQSMWSPHDCMISLGTSWLTLKLILLKSFFVMESLLKEAPLYAGMCGCVLVCVCVYACARACVLEEKKQWGLTFLIPSVLTLTTEQDCVAWTRGPLPVTSLMAGATEFPVLEKRILYLSTAISNLVGLFGDWC